MKYLNKSKYQTSVLQQQNNAVPELAAKISAGVKLPARRETGESVRHVACGTSLSSSSSLTKKGDTGNMSDNC